MNFEALHFIRPAWLLCLPLALLLPLAWRHFRRPSGDWAKVCDSHLLRWLSVGEQSSRPGSLGAIAAGLALALTALALSGPSWQRLPDSSFSARDARVLVFDLSRSMLAEDLKPNRLTQARFRLLDMLESTREGQIGLVAFAGDAYIVSPLTSDMNTIANMLPALQPDVMPVAGSRADVALELAADLLRRAGISSGEILLISDDANAADAARAQTLAEDGILTSVLAVGTREGAPIPSGTGFVSDDAGNVVITRLDSEALAAVAQAGQGRLTFLDSGSVKGSPWLQAEGGAFARRDDALGERWKDTGPWLVLLLLPLAAFGFRRGLLFVLPLTVLPSLMIPVAAEAKLWDDLWQRRDQQAQEALRNQQAERAARLAKNPSIAAEALYRNGNYEEATRTWMRSDGADAHYNRGNALALAGEFEAAMAAYDQALAQNPEMEDALFNRALVEQMKEQQDQQQQEGEGDQSEDESQQDGESEQQEGEGESQEGQEGEESEEQQGEQQEQSQQEMESTWSEEDAQAMEQWLRRIPDDPGGLLRRKFRSQHQRRGAPPDETKDW